MRVEDNAHAVSRASLRTDESDSRVTKPHQSMQDLPLGIKIK